jgi:hypothetical protein
VFRPQVISYCFYTPSNNNNNNNDGASKSPPISIASNPVAVLGWSIDNDIRCVVQGYRSLTSALFFEHDLTLALKLHSIILTGLYNVPPCRGINVLNLVRLFSKYNINMENNNNLKQQPQPQSEVGNGGHLRKRLALFVAYGQTILRFLVSEGQLNRNNLSFTVQEVQESGVPWLLPTLLSPSNHPYPSQVSMSGGGGGEEKQQQPYSSSSSSSSGYAVKEDVVGVISHWYNDLIASLSSSHNNNSEEEEEGGEGGGRDDKDQLLIRLDQYIAQSLICAAQSEVFSNSPSFKSMSVPLFAAVMGHQSHLALASLSRCNALIPTVMQSVTNWRAAGGGGGGGNNASNSGGGAEDKFSKGGTPGSTPTLARSATLMEREELWADVSLRVDKMQVLTTDEYIYMIYIKFSFFSFRFPSLSPLPPMQCLQHIYILYTCHDHTHSLPLLFFFNSMYIMNKICKKVRAMAARGNISQHQNALNKLKGACLTIASRTNDVELIKECEVVLIMTPTLFLALFLAFFLN